MSIGPSMPLRLEKPERIDLAQAARYFGARGGADAATQALLEKCAVPLLADYPNLLVCGTFSKSRSLAGLRLGFAIGSPELIGVLEAVKNSYNSYTVDNLSLLCGAAAMDDEAYFAKTTAAVITTRERVRRALEQMGFSVLPSRSNFLFATKDGASMRELFLYLKQRHIYIRYFDLPRIDNYVRITIGTDAQMDAFLQGTEAFLRGE